MSKKNKYRVHADFPEMRTVKEIVLYGAEHGAVVHFAQAPEQISDL